MMQNTTANWCDKSTGGDCSPSDAVESDPSGAARVSGAVQRFTAARLPGATQLSWVAQLSQLEEDLG